MKKFICDLGVLEQAIALAKKQGHSTMFLTAFSNPEGIVLSAQVKDTATKGKGKPYARCGREWVNYKAQPQQAAPAPAQPAPAQSVPAGTVLPF